MAGSLILPRGDDRLNEDEPLPEDSFEPLELPPITELKDALPSPYLGDLDPLTRAESVYPADRPDDRLINDSELLNTKLQIEAQERILPDLGGYYLPIDALKRSAQEAINPTRSWYYDCLFFCRTRYGIPSRYGSASLAYYNTNHRHTSWPPPAGAFPFWTGGAGHITMSIGDGTCWTNDYAAPGRISRARIKDITWRWAKPYRGWAEDVNEVRAMNPASFIDLSKTIAAARYGRHLHHGPLLKRALAAEVGKGSMDFNTNYIGRGFTTQYKKLQIKWYGKGNGIPGYTSMVRLCRKHDLTLIP